MGSDVRELRVLDLFSGIGGFSLGLEMAGPFRTVGFVEYDKKAQAVLRKHWPDVPIFDDVRKFDGTEVGPVDVVCGGFPCQPFSRASRGRACGTADPRHLWPEMRRIIEESGPSWVIAENVAGFVQVGVDSLLSDLEAIGYTCGSLVIPATAVGAPHFRDRVWVVGNTHHESESAFKKHDEVAGVSESFARPRGGGRPWPNPPRDLRMDDGLPGRVDRLKQLGNAVVPQVVAELGRAILGVERGN